MKSIALILALFAATTYSTAQSTYVIKTQGTTYTQQQVEEAIEAANFCGYHYVDERHLLLFNDGTEVELKSSEELSIEGNPLAANCITNDKKESPVVWAISSNGTILRGGASTDKKMRLK